jgi:Uma2 family endonuclease
MRRLGYNAAMTIQMPRHLFTVDDYYRMAEAGILRANERVELIEGEVVEMVPIGSHHAHVVDNLAALLIRRTTTRDAVVRVQGPVRLSQRSEPQPDIAVLKPHSYMEGHPGPADILLLVEVADSTLLSDQRVKVPLYARVGIPEVWIANLANETIEVYSHPTESGYSAQTVLTRGQHVTPEALPTLKLPVDDILG